MADAVKKSAGSLPEKFEHYTQKDDRNQVIYHNRSEDTADKISSILKDAAALIELCGPDHEEISEYQLLLRVLNEQAVRGEDGGYRLREKGEEMKADCLQNPADPDATYGEKAGKQYRGYVANIMEERSEHGSIITDYQYEQNTHSDQEFAKEVIGSLGKQETPVTFTAHGAYSGEEIEKAARANNIEVINTNLTGREAPDIYADFEFNEEGTRITACANGHAPKSSSYNAKTGQCTASIHKSQCEGYPYADSCKRKINKRTVRVTLSIRSKHRAELQLDRGSGEFKAATHFRNGVETIPSFLRRIFNVDHMPVRGKLRTKLQFGFKISGLNFLKLCKYEQRMVKCDSHLKKEGYSCLY